MRTPLAIYGSRKSHFRAIHGPRNCAILVISSTMIPKRSERSRAENHCTEEKNLKQQQQIRYLIQGKEANRNKTKVLVMTLARQSRVF
jgi:hypothetical protein